jgi:phosphate uptake regulator
MGLFDLFSEGAPPLVEEAFENVTNMLSDGHHMFESATAFALDNEILDDDLSAVDEDINRCEQELRRSLLEHLTVNPDREMVFSLKLISIVGEAERIGDIAKSIVKAGRLAHKPRMGPHVEPLRDMRNRVRTMFDLAKQGFVEEDPEAARTLMSMHEEIKDDTTVYLSNLAEADELTANEGIVYALLARLLSRVSSHLSNIASTVAAPFDRIRRAHPEGTDET